MKKNAISVLETLLQTMGEYPVIAHVLSGTNILYDCVEVVAEATGRDPGEIMRGLRERNRERMRELSIRRIDVQTVRTLPDEWIKVGGSRRYKGWLIKRPEEKRYLCFTPENIDYPEEGYEDIEVESANFAKDWIDHYAEEEE